MKFSKDVLDYFLVTYKKAHALGLRNFLDIWESSFGGVKIPPPPFGIGLISISLLWLEFKISMKNTIQGGQNSRYAIFSQKLSFWLLSESRPTKREIFDLPNLA